MKQIGTSWDRNNRNIMNENFTEAERKVLEQKQRVDRLIQDVPQPSEVVDARGEHAVLGDRLNDFTAQLAQTEELAVSTVSHKVDRNVVVTFQDDDGFKEVLTILWEKIFKLEGVPFSFCVNTSNVGTEGRLTVDDMRFLESQGNTAFSHGHEHIYHGDVSDEVADESLRLAKENLKAWGMSGYDILAYPYGSAKVKTREIAKRYYRAAFSVNNTSYNTMPLDQFYIRRHGIASHTFEELKSLVDNAPDNTLLVFFDHVWETHYQDQSFIDGYRDFVQYIKSQNIPIKNVKEAIDLKGNVLDVGNGTNLFAGADNYVKIGRDGSFEKSYYNNQDIDSNTPIHNFPYGETRQFFNYPDANARGFNFGAGELVTHRVQSSHYSSAHEVGNRQLFIEASTNRVHKRRWNATDGVWGEWELITDHVVSQTRNEYTSSSPIADFPQNTVHTFYYNSQNQGDFPFFAGIVTTYRMNEVAWNRQEVREYQGNRKAVRYWDTVNNKWFNFWFTPQFIGNANITVNDTIPANSTINKTLSLGSVNKDQVITAQPDGAVENGVVWSVYASSVGVATLRIANVTNSPITISNQVWKIQRLSY